MPQCELTQPILSSQWTAVRAQINTADSGGVMPPLCGDAENDCAACDSAGLGLALRIGDRRGGKDAHVVLGALKGEHVALYKDATPARTAVPLEQPIVVNEVAGQTEL